MPITTAGFDYGTSHCALATCNAGRVQQVPLAPDRTQLPSTMYSPDATRIAPGSPGLLFGDDAIAAYLADPGEGWFVKSPKSFLGARNLAPVVQRRFVHVVAAMMATVRQRAAAHLGDAPAQVVVGQPVNFQQLEAPEANAHALDVLTEAAQLAGFEAVQFLFEPLAAAMDFEATLDREQRLLVVDIGGGTSDCSFVLVGPDRARHADRSADVLGHSGERIGGNDFDQQLALAALMPPCGFGSLLDNGRAVPNVHFTDAVTVNDVNAQQRFYSAANRETLARHLAAAAEPERLARLLQVLDRRLGYRVVQVAEQAKIQLSTTPQANALLPELDPPVAASASRETLAEASARLLERLDRLVQAAVADGGCRPDLVYLTGGMAGAPLLRDRVAGLLPDVPMVDGDHFGSVTQGLARHAERLFAI